MCDQCFLVPVFFLPFWPGTVSVNSWALLMSMAIVALWALKRSTTSWRATSVIRSQLTTRTSVWRQDGKEKPKEKITLMFWHWCYNTELQSSRCDIHQNTAPHLNIKKKTHTHISYVKELVIHPFFSDLDEAACAHKCKKHMWVCLHVCQCAPSVSLSSDDGCHHEN